MSGVVTLVVGGAMVVLLLDRVLRHMEDRGWIYYRKTKPVRGAIAYHVLETSSVFNPSFRVVQEIQVEEQRRHDAAGDPPGAPTRDEQAG